MNKLDEKHVTPTRQISDDEIRQFELHRLWKRVRHMDIHTPLAKQVKAQLNHYHLESLTHEGGIRIETNFKMRS